MITAFVLGINMVIAAIFAIAFAVVATTNRSARGAGWLATGYAAGVVDAALEFTLHWRGDAGMLTIGIYLTFLAALTFCLIGVARFYRVRGPWRAIMLIWFAGVIMVPVIFSLPYGSGLRNLLYQLPYAAIQLLIAATILRSSRARALDLLLAGLNGLMAGIYLAKPAIASLTGTAKGPPDYLASVYAAISQSIGAVALVVLALVLLMVMMRDATAEMQARAETDPLSNALNRRGFEARAEGMLCLAQRSGDYLTLVTADLDHFKAINDSYGHAAGDDVIAHFADLLTQLAPEGAVVSRLGGEEFAVLLPGADLVFGRRYAENVRDRFSAGPLAWLAIDRVITASFGVAQMGADDRLIDLTSRADGALYRAKNAGRNRVHLALGELSRGAAPAQIGAPIRQPPIMRARLPQRLLAVDAD